MGFPTTGLYAITQTENKTDEQLFNDIEAVIKGGAVVVQYRDKRLNDKKILATELVKICHQYHVPLIINDDAQLAADVGADGVHLGKEDGDIKDARALLGETAIIGVSCYNDLTKAKNAQQQGADYVAFGRFFPSSSKPLASPAEIDTLIAAKKHLQIPIVAIGGILPSNGRQLLQAGADVLAVIGGVFKQQVEESAKAYQELFEK